MGRAVTTVALRSGEQDSLSLIGFLVSVFSILYLVTVGGCLVFPGCFLAGSFSLSF